MIEDFRGAFLHSFVVAANEDFGRERLFVRIRNAREISDFARDGFFVQAFDIALH